MLQSVSPLKGQDVVFVFVDEVRREPFYPLSSLLAFARLAMPMSCCRGKVLERHKELPCLISRLPLFLCGVIIAKK